jgi:hypothetical protein
MSNNNKKLEEKLLNELLETCKTKDLGSLLELLKDLEILEGKATPEEAKDLKDILLSIKKYVSVFSSATIIRADGTLETLDLFKTEINLDFLQKAVNGFIEIISIPNQNKKLVINEEGKMRGFAINHYATVLFRDAYDTTDYIVGDVVLLDSNLLF